MISNPRLGSTLYAPLLYPYVKADSARMRQALSPSPQISMQSFIGSDVSMK